MKRPRTFTPRRPIVAAFTLVEMLVVISIIVILIGILVPVIGKVRLQAQATDTNARIQSLASAIQAYFGDFGAYPGPVPNAQLRVTGDKTATPPGCGIMSAKDTAGNVVAFDPTAMSMAENLYLGLNGGLEPDTTNPNQFIFNAKIMGNGARALGPVPKKYKGYTDNTGVTKNPDGLGHFVDDDGTAAQDTIIPEYLDQFSAPMPVLYLRAKAGAPGVATTINHQTTPTDIVEQYDVQQVISYTDTLIGVGRKINQSDYVGATYPKHGLRTVDPAACIGAPPSTPAGLQTNYPYDLYAAVIDPSIQRKTATVNNPGTNTPRQRDGFILISAGIDRVYGTTDDITSFGKW